MAESHERKLSGALVPLGNEEINWPILGRDHVLYSFIDSRVKPNVAFSASVLDVHWYNMMIHYFQQL